MLDNLPLPPLNSRSFCSVSNYYYIARFFNLGETVSSGEFLERGRGLCQLPWKEVDDMAKKSKSKGDPIEEMCFRAIYLAAFLQDGLGFNPQGKSKSRRGRGRRKQRNEEEEMIIIWFDF